MKKRVFLHYVLTNNHSSFGMTLPGRTSSSTAYRYGFNGMEKDDELKGEGNSYTTEFRQYDPRIGRWLSQDPKAVFWESPYAQNRNNPIFLSDPNGDCPNGDCDDVKSPSGQTVSIPKGSAKHINEAGQVYSFLSQGSEFFYDSRDNKYYNLDGNRYSERLSIDFSSKSRFERALQNRVMDFKENDPSINISISTSDLNNPNHNYIMKEDGLRSSTLDVLDKNNYPEVGLGEGLVPLWGSGKETLYNLEDGEYGRATFNGILTISEVFGIGYVRKSAFKLLGKLPQGGKTFQAYKASKGGTKTLGYIEGINSEGRIVFQRISTEYHHWIFTQRTQRIYGLPDWLVNNRFNVLRINTIQHSLMDPFRFRFLKKGIKEDVGIFKKFNWFYRNFNDF